MTHMQRPITLLLFLVALSLTGWSQKYLAEKSVISFYSHAAMEDIQAENKKAVALFNASTGEIVFSIPINGFEFAKSLMQEHFNEKYMESDKFPKANFKGKITGFDASASGAQKAKATGEMTIHGVTKSVEIPGTLEKSGDTLLLKAVFIVKLVDYNITIPHLFWKKIAEQVEVTVDFVLKPE